MDTDHCNTCQHHEYLMSIVKDTTEDIRDIKEDISIIKLSIAERNAFLKGIKSTLKLIAAIISAGTAILGYNQISKITSLFK